MLLSDFHSCLSTISEYEYKIEIILYCADCHTFEKVHIPLNSEALCFGGSVLRCFGASGAAPQHIRPDGQIFPHPHSQGSTRPRSPSPGLLSYLVL